MTQSIKVDFFKSEDFDPKFGWDFDNNASHIAKYANELLLERGTVVYGVTEGSPVWVRHKDNNCKYSAILVSVEKLPEPECVHEAFENGRIIDSHVACKHCGKNLKMPTKWDVEE